MYKFVVSQCAEIIVNELVIIFKVPCIVGFHRLLSQNSHILIKIKMIKNGVM